MRISYSEAEGKATTANDNKIKKKLNAIRSLAYSLGACVANFKIATVKSGVVVVVIVGGGGSGNV